MQGCHSQARETHEEWPARHVNEGPPTARRGQGTERPKAEPRGLTPCRWKRRRTAETKTKTKTKTKVQASQIEQLMLGNRNARKAEQDEGKTDK